MGGGNRDGRLTNKMRLWPGEGSGVPRLWVMAPGIRIQGRRVSPDRDWGQGKKYKTSKERSKTEDLKTSWRGEGGDAGVGERSGCRSPRVRGSVWSLETREGRAESGTPAGIRVELGPTGNEEAWDTPGQGTSGPRNIRRRVPILPILGWGGGSCRSKTGRSWAVLRGPFSSSLPPSPSSL